MGRFASALAFLFTFAVILGSAGCGQRFDELGAGQAPAPADLAAEALAALEQAGSAHVVVDTSGGSISGTAVELRIHFEGDASGSAVAGDGEISFPGATLGARLLVDEHHVYVRFMGAWYEADTGIADALTTAKSENEDLLTDLTTPAGLGKRFAELFDGEVTEGPVVDGVATWKFDGRLSADTFARYVKEFGGMELSANDRELLGKVAASTHVVLVVGQDDHLPRRLDFRLEPPHDLRFDSQELQSSAQGAFKLTVELSDFGKDVSFTAPKDAKPLDALFEQFFAGLG